MTDRYISQRKRAPRCADGTQRITTGETRASALLAASTHGRLVVASRRWGTRPVGVRDRSDDTHGDDHEDDHGPRSLGQMPPASTTDASPPIRKTRKAVASLRSCDANIKAKAGTTTCAYAENVFYGYWLNESEPGVFADSPGVPAYSPAAGRMINAKCSGAEQGRLQRRRRRLRHVLRAMRVAADTLENAKAYAASKELGDVPAPSDTGDEATPASPSNGAGDACDPSYEGACLDPNSSDYDCEGGSGDGPDYTGTVRVVGDDHFGLDRDGDGTACGLLMPFRLYPGDRPLTSTPVYAVRGATRKAGV